MQNKLSSTKPSFLKFWPELLLFLVFILSNGERTLRHFGTCRGFPFIFSSEKGFVAGNLALNFGVAVLALLALFAARRGLGNVFKTPFSRELFEHRRMVDSFVWACICILPMTAFSLYVASFFSGAGAFEMQHRYEQVPLIQRSLLALTLMQLVLLPLGMLIAGVLQIAVGGTPVSKRFKYFGVSLVIYLSAFFFTVILPLGLLDGISDGDWVRVFGL